MSQTVLISGASSGIGEALARKYAEDGANVVLLARRLEKLEALASELSGPRQKAVAIQADVTQDGEVESAVARAIAEFGRIDVVVANAGFGVIGRLDRLTMADYRRQFEVNVFGVLRAIYATLDEMKQRRGRIVLIGSVASTISMPEATPYCMSKFALAGLADGLGAELARFGVSVTLIMPGFVETAIFDVSNKNEPIRGGGDRPPRFLMMPAKKAAAQIVRAVKNRKRRQVITLHGKLAVWMSRFFPGLVAWVSRRGEG